LNEKGWDVRKGKARRRRHVSWERKRPKERPHDKERPTTMTRRRRRRSCCRNQAKIKCRPRVIQLHFLGQFHEWLQRWQTSLHLCCETIKVKWSTAEKVSQEIYSSIIPIKNEEDAFLFCLRSHRKVNLPMVLFPSSDTLWTNITSRQREMQW
jgi:hypothetical protein